MKISTLCIGDELLKGITVNTNHSFIGQELLSLGLVPENSLVVADDKQALTDALDYLFSHTDLVITTGGLGPTADDMTKQIVAEYVGRELVENAGAMAKLQAYWAKRHERRDLPRNIEDQALVIDGAIVFQNEQGSAPGMWVQLPESKSPTPKYLVMLPGPPREMQPMFTNDALPLIKKHSTDTTANKLFYIAGMPESIVEAKMQPLINQYPTLSVAYCASYEGVKLFLRDREQAVVDSVAAEVNTIFKEHILPENHTDLAADIVRLLNEKECSLSTAESCTGGKIAGRITDVSGSSAVFPGGFVVYCNEWKHEQLGISNDIFEEYGAVSEQCVEALVTNLCDRYGTEAGIAVSGIAGPGGGTPEKPVGLVYIGVKLADKCIVERYEFTGNRKAVRDRTVAKALNTLRSMLICS